MLGQGRKGKTYAIARVATGRGGGDGDGRPPLAGAVGADAAGVGAAAVGVDLVECHLHLAAGGDLRQLVARLGHDGGRAGLEGVVAAAEGLAKGRGRVAAEAGGVLLEGVAPGAVAGGRGVDAEGHAVAAGVAGCGNDGAVAGCEAGGGEEGEGEESLEGRHGGWWVGWASRWELVEVVKGIKDLSGRRELKKSKEKRTRTAVSWMLDECDDEKVSLT